MGKATFTEWAGQGGAGCYRHRGRAMLLIADSDMGDAADAAIAAAGGRPMRRIAWAEVEAGLAAVVAAPVVLAEAGGVAPERLEQALPTLCRFLDTMETRGVVTFGPGQIDLVARHLMDAPVELLCDATIPQRALALAQAALPRALMLNDSMPDRVEDDRHAYSPQGAESDDQHIRRMAEGIAQISRITAGLLSHTAPAEAGPIAAAASPASLRPAVRSSRRRRCAASSSCASPAAASSASSSARGCSRTRRGTCCSTCSPPSSRAIASACPACVSPPVSRRPPRCAGSPA